jgi:hypothetical protein
MEQTRTDCPRPARRPHRASPGEVRDRPAIRHIVNELAQRHPHTAGVRELHTAMAMAL